MTSPVKRADPNHLSGAATCALGGCALGGTPGFALKGGDLGGPFQGGVFGAAVLFGVFGAAVLFGVLGAGALDFPGGPAAELELDAVERDFALLPSPTELGGEDFGAGGPAGAAAGGPAGPPHFH